METPRSHRWPYDILDALNAPPAAPEPSLEAFNQHLLKAYAAANGASNALMAARLASGNEQGVMDAFGSAVEHLLTLTNEINDAIQIQRVRFGREPG